MKIVNSKCKKSCPFKWYKTPCDEGYFNELKCIKCGFTMKNKIK